MSHKNLTVLCMAYPWQNETFFKLSPQNILLLSCARKHADILENLLTCKLLCIHSVQNKFQLYNEQGKEELNCFLRTFHYSLNALKWPTNFLIMITLKEVYGTEKNAHSVNTNVTQSSVPFNHQIAQPHALILSFTAQ